MHGSRAHASGRQPVQRSLAALFVVAGLALTGCQANPEPPPLETAPSPSPSPTEPTFAPAPTMPPEAEGTSRAAAKAFVRHWIEVLNYAGANGDADAIRSLSTPGCTACNGIAEFIDEVHEAGGLIEGQGWRPKRITIVSGGSQTMVLDVLTEVAEQRVKTDQNAKARTFPGGVRVKTFSLETVEGNWAVSRLDQPQ